ncbi:MAG: PH domain-containing protein [Ilumatobacteraceae bacterium]
MSTAADRELLAAPVRQSPIALVFIAWRFIRRLGIVNIGAALLFTLARGFSIGLWIAATLAAIAVLVHSLLSWWRSTFLVSRDELVITSGVLSVERLVIPLDRVQSVSIDQRLLHRPFGLVGAAVDTAGSQDAEFEIAAIGVGTAEALRRLASDARVASGATSSGQATAGSSPPAPPGGDRVLLRRSPRQLALAGATRLPWAGLAVLAPLLAFGDDVDVLDGFTGWVEDLVERWTGDSSAGGVLVIVALLIAVAALFGTALQTVREIVTNWNLTVYRTPTGLRRTAGLLSTTSRSATLRRVHAIVTDDTPPQRWLGFTTLTLKAVGSNDIVLPGSPPDDVTRLRALLFGVAAPPPLDRRISGWFVFVAVRNAALVAALVAVVVWFRVGWWSASVLVVVPLRGLAAGYQWQRRRWGLDEDRIAESYGLIRRRTTEAPLRKTQVVKVTQSFFERRRGLATVRVQTAGGFIAVPFIDRHDALAVRDRVLYAVETDGRPVL